MTTLNQVTIELIRNNDVQLTLEDMAAVLRLPRLPTAIGILLVFLSFYLIISSFTYTKNNTPLQGSQHIVKDYSAGLNGSGISGDFQPSRLVHYRNAMYTSEKRVMLQQLIRKKPCSYEDMKPLISK